MPPKPQIDDATLIAAVEKTRNPDGSINISGACRYLGAHRSTLQERVWRIFGKDGIGKQATPPPTQSEIDARKLTALQAENTDLKRRLKEAHLNSLDDDAVREILGGIVAAPAKPPEWLIDETPTKGATPEVPVTIWSDWHVGEAVSFSETNGVNEYGIDIFKERAKRLVSRTIDLCQNHGPGNYPGAVVNILGDMVSGGLHPELQKTDEQEVIPAVLTCRDTLIWCLEQIIDAFGNIYVPCTSGNHGRSTHKPEFKRYVYKNFDWLIYQLLARHFKGRREIVIDIPDSNEVYYRIFGRRYLAMHGDMMGAKGGDGIIGSIGPITRGEMKVGRQQSVMGRDYDVLLVGHWHQTLWLPRVIVNNTLKGWDEYAQKSLRAPPSVPSQSLWFEHPRLGKTMHREVFVEDPASFESAPWVSVFQSGDA